LTSPCWSSQESNLNQTLAEWVQMEFETTRASDTTVTIIRVLHMIIILGLGLGQ
jgi:hypothetical protein